MGQTDGTKVGGKGGGVDGMAGSMCVHTHTLCKDDSRCQQQVGDDAAAHGLLEELHVGAPPPVVRVVGGHDEAVEGVH